LDEKILIFSALNLVQFLIIKTLNLDQYPDPHGNQCGSETLVFTTMLTSAEFNPSFVGGWMSISCPDLPEALAQFCNDRHQKLRRL
jgi:hypothetical protein